MDVFPSHIPALKLALKLHNALGEDRWKYDAAAVEAAILLPNWVDSLALVKKLTLMPIDLVLYSPNMPWAVQYSLNKTHGLLVEFTVADTEPLDLMQFSVTSTAFTGQGSSPVLQYTAAGYGHKRATGRMEMSLDGMLQQIQPQLERFFWQLELESADDELINHTPLTAHTQSAVKILKFLMASYTH